MTRGKCRACFYWGLPAAAREGDCASVQAHPEPTATEPEHSCAHFRPRSDWQTAGDGMTGRTLAIVADPAEFPRHLSCAEFDQLLDAIEQEVTGKRRTLNEALRMAAALGIEFMSGTLEHDGFKVEARPT